MVLLLIKLLADNKVEVVAGSDIRHILIYCCGH